MAPPLPPSPADADLGVPRDVTVHVGRWASSPAPLFSSSSHSLGPEAGRPLNASLVKLLSLAALSGICLALSAPPNPAPALAFLSPAFLYAALYQHGLLTPARARTAFVLGWVCGSVCNLIALRWTVGMLQDFGGFPLIAAAPTALLLFMAQGVPMGLATFFAAGHGRRPWLWFPITLAIAYSVTPGVFPWHPAVTQVAWLEWVQLAELGGEPLLDALWALVGAASAHALLTRCRVALIAAMVALIFPWAYGVVRVSEVEDLRRESPALRVGVVQPNIGIEEKHDPSLWFDHLGTLRDQTLALEADGAELVVWPESAYPFPIRRGRQLDGVGETRILADGVRGPILFGAVTSGGPCQRYNSVIALNREGRIVGVGDKVELLAFGEYVPLWDYLPPLQSAFPCRGLVPGDAPASLRLAQTDIGVLNCYEDVLAHYAWMVTRRGPHFLVNVTNDAWFGDTDEPFLHQQVARLRSIETRRDLVRSVNTGVSAHITATGREAVTTSTYAQTQFIAEVARLEVMTPWVRYGDLLTPVLILLWFWRIGLTRRRIVDRALTR